MISDTDKDRIQVGLKQVKKAVEGKKAEKVYLAVDCDSTISNQIKSLCSREGVAVEEVPSMRELGTMCGIEVKASCAVILK